MCIRTPIKIAHITVLCSRYRSLVFVFVDTAAAGLTELAKGQRVNLTFNDVHRAAIQELKRSVRR